MPLDATRDAFQAVGDTATAYPVHSMPPMLGAIFIAVIGSSHLRKGKYWEVREAARFPNAKVRAVCLGSVRTFGGVPTREPCELEAETLEDLARLHGPPGEVRKAQRSHTIALWSEDGLDPEAYARALAEHEERVEAYRSTKSYVEKQALLSQWKADRLSDPRHPFASQEIIGLLTDEPWQSLAIDVRG